MKFLSVCSGIEAASAAWTPLGWKAWGFSEIEPFPCALLAHHYPDVPNFGDMTKFEDWPLPAHDEPPIDLLCGGTPCQSFSVAGLRKGLDDERGNLMLIFARIAAKYRPAWLVWENVPGVLSSNAGRDFASFLGLLSGQRIDPPREGWSNSGIVPGYRNAYGLAWRTLDAQYFGVAQRRRRVFVVGYLGDWRRAAAVLFERHSLSGHPSPRRETGQRPTDSLASRTTGGGGLGTDFECDGGLIPDITATLTKSALDGSSICGGDGRESFLVPEIVGQAMSAKWAKGTAGPAGPAGPAGDEHHNLLAVPAITHSLRAGGHDASEDGTGYHIETAYTLTKSDQHAVQFAMQVRRLTPRECERLQGFPDDYTLTPNKRIKRVNPAKVCLDFIKYLMRGGSMTFDECTRTYADGPRYKALGNSWAVPCAAWIGQRINAVNAITNTQQDKEAA